MASTMILLPLPPPPQPRPPKLRKEQLLPQRQRTNPAVWLCASCCVILCVLIILSGIATLIIFLVVKPRYPLFQVTAASLNSIYLDAGEYLNGDYSFLVNFSNPNRKMEVRFEYIEMELYFSDRHIGMQTIQPPLALSSINGRLKQLQLSVHMISSQVYLSRNVSMLLQKEVESNRVMFYIRGRFRVRAILNGNIHFVYWLHVNCQLVMTAPPTGVLSACRCSTKRGS